MGQNSTLSSESDRRSQISLICSNSLNGRRRIHHKQTTNTTCYYFFQSLKNKNTRYFRIPGEFASRSLQRIAHSQQRITIDTTDANDSRPLSVKESGVRGAVNVLVNVYVCVHCLQTLAHACKSELFM